MARLSEVAKIIRSKNAGPFHLTFDIMCDDLSSYEQIKSSGLLSEKLIADIYAVPPQYIRIFDYPAAYSFKITIPRRVTSGDPNDTDVYGAQQHAPLLSLEIP